jgi:hypothetical protein
MPKFLVTVRRTRTIQEHATVVVNSSSEHYALRDANSAATLEDKWETTTASTSEPVGLIAAL